MTCAGAPGRAEVGKAEVQWAAGHFLGTVTKAHDRGEEDPQDRVELPAAARGLGLCLLASPPSPQTQKVATCPDCQ